MTYANFKLDTVTALGIIAEDWDAKPPTKLDIAGAGYTITPKVAIGSNIAGSAADTMNVLDQAFVKSMGIFCNFADGLIFDDDTNLYAIIGYTIDGATYLGAKLWVRIAALNVMFAVNRFLPEKSSVAAGNTLKLLATISGSNPATGKFGTGSINPDLADAGAHVAGEMPLRFDIVAEIEHSYDLT